jgi:hypothetical protein
VSLADAAACSPDTAAVGALLDPLTETRGRVEQIDGSALPGLAATAQIVNALEVAARALANVAIDYLTSAQP